MGGCIAVNRLHPEERRRWTLAHEYAHFLADRQRADVLPDVIVRRSDSERFADAFARSFLLPESGIVRRFHQARANNKPFTLAELFLLAHDYGVSVEAMTLRLEEFRLLQPGLWNKLKAGGLKVRDAQRELGLSPLPGNDDLLPRHYQHLALEALERDLITEGQFAHFLRVDRLAARQRLESLRQTLDEAAFFINIAEFPPPWCRRTSLVSDLVSPHDHLILDACCAINLFATDHADAILRSVGRPIAIARYVVERELLSLAALAALRNETLEERLTRNETMIVALQDEEEELFLTLAAQVDDGEAITAAIAISRRWAIATDERKTSAVLNRIAPSIRVVTTPELVKHWAEEAEIDGATLRDVLATIETTAHFHPWRSHPLYNWWRSSVW